jgi:hypothetical protein
MAYTSSHAQNFIFQLPSFRGQATANFLDF